MKPNMFITLQYFKEFFDNPFGNDQYLSSVVYYRGINVAFSSIANSSETDLTRLTLGHLFPCNLQILRYLSRACHYKGAFWWFRLPLLISLFRRPPNDRHRACDSRDQCWSILSIQIKLFLCRPIGMFLISFFSLASCSCSKKVV